MSFMKTLMFALMFAVLGLAVVSQVQTLTEAVLAPMQLVAR